MTKDGLNYLEKQPLYLREGSAFEHLQKQEGKTHGSRLGDLKKPTCNFTADSNMIALKTELAKKKIKEMKMKQSKSLRMQKGSAIAKELELSARGVKRKLSPRTKN